MLVQVGLDPPVQRELLAEQGGLDDLAFSPERALVPVPGRPVTGQPRG
jgi:hypothetical protein